MSDPDVQEAQRQQDEAQRQRDDAVPARSTLANVDVPVVRCPTCEVPYILRMSFSLTGGEDEWIYQKDCKHKPKAQQVDQDKVEYALLRVARLRA